MLNVYIRAFIILKKNNESLRYMSTSFSLEILANLYEQHRANRTQTDAVSRTIRSRRCKQAAPVDGSEKKKREKKATERTWSKKEKKATTWTR